MNAKHIIRQYRRKERKRELPDLIHLIINVRSNRHIYVNKYIRQITGNKSLHRQYTIKSDFIKFFGKDCFLCDIITPSKGNKTWQKDGKFYSHNPEYPDGLPF